MLVEKHPGYDPENPETFPPEKLLRAAERIVWNTMVVALKCEGDGPFRDRVPGFQQALRILASLYKVRSNH